MRVFVTGASGWIGSAVVPELISAGHEVIGLARSDRSAAAVEAAGARVHRGDLDDLGSLRAGAEQADGVVHLGYHHDFSQMAEAAALDRAAIDTFGEVLSGSGGPLVVAGGVLGIGGPGQVATEADRPDPNVHPRVANGEFALAQAERGVRSVLMRFAPTVHGEGDRGFVATLAELARRSGVAGYVGDGSNRWPAVNRADAAVLVRLAVEQGAPGTVLHAVGEEGIATRAIAEALGRSVGVGARSIDPAGTAEHFGWIGAFFAMDAASSNALTRRATGWQPTHAGLIEDIDAGYYADVQPHSTGG